MKILAVSGSLRKKSSNTALLRALVALAPAGVEVVLAASLDQLPHFNPDLEQSGAPPAVENWRKEIESSSGVCFCSPEYAYGIPGVLKNALDWEVSSGKLYRKPVAIITASPGPDGGLKAQASLIQTLTAMSANIVHGALVSVPAVYRRMDGEGNLIDPQVLKSLEQSLTILLSAIEGKEIWPASA